MWCPLFPNTCYDEVLIYYNCGEKWCAHVHVAVCLVQSVPILENIQYIFVRLVIEKKQLKFS